MWIDIQEYINSISLTGTSTGFLEVLEPKNMSSIPSWLGAGNARRCLPPSSLVELPPKYTRWADANLPARSWESTNQLTKSCLQDTMIMMYLSVCSLDLSEYEYHCLIWIVKRERDVWVLWNNSVEVRGEESNIVWQLSAYAHYGSIMTWQWQQYSAAARVGSLVLDLSHDDKSCGFFIKFL